LKHCCNCSSSALELKFWNVPRCNTTVDSDFAHMVNALREPVVSDAILLELLHGSNTTPTGCAITGATLATKPASYLI
jgi:hypothetical protein